MFARAPPGACLLEPLSATRRRPHRSFAFTSSALASLPPPQPRQLPVTRGLSYPYPVARGTRVGDGEAIPVQQSAEVQEV
jgi:hypothetical protein